MSVIKRPNIRLYDTHVTSQYAPLCYRLTHTTGRSRLSLGRFRLLLQGFRVRDAQVCWDAHSLLSSAGTLIAPQRLCFPWLGRSCELGTLNGYICALRFTGTLQVCYIMWDAHGAYERPRISYTGPLISAWDGK